MNKKEEGALLACAETGEAQLHGLLMLRREGADVVVNEFAHELGMLKSSI